MWCWATSSSRGPLLVALAALLLPGAAAAQTFLTQEEALRLAFPEPSVIERRTAFFGDEDLDRVRKLVGSNVPVSQRIVTYYVGVEGDRTLGFAYFDAHRVRTMREVLMIVVTPASTVERIEVLRFGEPREYVASSRWLDQFEDAELDGRLGAKDGIVNLTGATLTSRAVVRAVRRVLALHELIREAGGGTG